MLVVYKDVAVNDIAWGNQKIIYDVRVHQSGVQCLLATGLAQVLKIAELSRAPSDYPARAGALATCGLPCGRHLWHVPFFFHSMKALWGSYGVNDFPGFDLERVHGPFFSDEPFCEDGDQGPRRIWHRESGRVFEGNPWRAVYDTQGDTARAWGFVLWACQRLGYIVQEKTWKSTRKIAKTEDVFYKSGLWKYGEGNGWNSRYANETRASWGARAE